MKLLEFLKEFVFDWWTYVHTYDSHYVPYTSYILDEHKNDRKF